VLNLVKFHEGVCLFLNVPRHEPTTQQKATQVHLDRQFLKHCLSAFPATLIPTFPHLTTFSSSSFLLVQLRKPRSERKRNSYRSFDRFLFRRTKATQFHLDRITTQGRRSFFEVKPSVINFSSNHISLTLEWICFIIVKRPHNGTCFCVLSTTRCAGGQ